MERSNIVLNNKSIKNKVLPSPHKQKGAGMIFTAMLIPVFGIAIILLSNITQLALEKIRLQQTADQAALSAAAIQAIGLNELADLNHAAVDEHEIARDALNPTSGPWFNQGIARQAESYHREVFSWIERYRQEANVNYAVLADEFARHVVDVNLADPNIRVEQVQGSSIDTLGTFNPVPEFVIRYQSYSGATCSTFNQPCVDSSLYSRPFERTDVISTNGRDGSIPFPLAFGVPTPLFYNPDVRWLKDQSRTTYAAYKLTQPQKRFAVGPAFLKSFFPEIVVYAAAKPTGGDVFNREPNYVPRLVHLGQLTPAPGVPNLSEVDH